jgi:hypothetical protein
MSGAWAQVFRALLTAIKSTAPCSPDSHSKVLGERLSTHKLTAEDLFRQNTPVSHYPKSVRPPIVVIPHNGSPLLSRCVLSLLTSLPDMSAPLVVVAPSVEASGVEATLYPVRSAIRATACQLRCVSLDGARQYADVLGRTAGVDRDVLNFALGMDGKGGFAAGSVRNQILLLLSNERLLSIDDDAEYAFISHPKIADSALALTAHKDTSSVYVGRDVSQIVKAGLSEHWSSLVFNLFSNWIGGCPLQCLSRLTISDKGEMCRDMVRSLYFQAARIGAVFPGLYGDPGSDCSMYLSALDEERGRRDLVCSAEDYLAGHRSREVIRVNRMPTLLHGGPFMSGLMGLDNNGTLPPFFPRFRNSDGIFGWMCSQCCTGFLSMHLPWAHKHYPRNVRSIPRHGEESGRFWRFSDLFLALARSFLAPSASVLGHDLATLGVQLNRVNRLRRSSWCELVVEASVHYIAAELTFWESQLALYGGRPEFWAKSVRAYINERKDILLSADRLVPLEYREVAEADQWRLLREDLRLYGELLLSWSSLSWAARQLNWREWSRRL